MSVLTHSQDRDAQREFEEELKSKCQLENRASIRYCSFYTSPGCLNNNNTDFSVTPYGQTGTAFNGICEYTEAPKSQGSRKNLIPTDIEFHVKFTFHCGNDNDFHEKYTQWILLDFIQDFELHYPQPTKCLQFIMDENHSLSMVLYPVDSKGNSTGLGSSLLITTEIPVDAQIEIKGLFSPYGSVPEMSTIDFDTIIHYVDGTEKSYKTNENWDGWSSQWTSLSFKFGIQELGYSVNDWYVGVKFQKVFLKYFTPYLTE